MNKIKGFFSALLLLLICSSNAFAVPARRTPTEVPLPDGTKLTVCLQGDEFAHYYTTPDQYPLFRAADGYFYYAVQGQDGKLCSSDYKASDINRRTSAEKAFLNTINPQQLIEIREQEDEVVRRSAARNSVQKAKYPTTGVQKCLVILVEFSDEHFYTENPYDAFNNMLNQEGYSENNGTGSARDYFIASSAGQFMPEFDVYGPVRLDKPMKYYGEDKGSSDRAPEDMVIEACQKLDDEIDFKQYDLDGDGQVDNIYVYYAGYGQATTGYADTIWPHSWNIYEGTKKDVKLDGVRLNHYACSNEIDLGEIMMGIGTFCHEFCHVLGLPDFYYPLNSICFTLGPWALMDYGNYNNDGRTPPYLGIYERYFLGWINPKEFTEPADIALADISENTGYIVKTENENEYFLFENRQQKGWDTYLPGHGMLVWHIDYDERLWSLNKSNMEPAHQRIDIIEADNKLTNKTRDGDPFPGTTNNTSFTDDTKPGMLSWNRQRLETPMTDIREEDGVIYFKVKGGAGGASVDMTENGSDNVAIHTEGSELVVVSNCQENLPICISNVSGAIIEKSEIVSGTQRFTLVNRGVYIVCIGDKTYKIMR